METSSKRHAWNIFQKSHGFGLLFSVTEFGPSPLQWDLPQLYGLGLVRRRHLILEVFTLFLFLLKIAYEFMVLE